MIAWYVRSTASLRSWLFAIMHNLFVSQLRKKKLGGEVTPIDTVRDERYRIAADQERYVEIRDVFQALKCLPEEQRSVLVLISVEDLSYAEAAQVLEIPVGTVMSRLPSKTLHRGNRSSDHLPPHSLRRANGLSQRIFCCIRVRSTGRSFE